MDPHSELSRRTVPTFLDDPLVIFRRFALWTVLCSVSAAPSFMVASGQYSRPAMVTGVAVFILLYTAGTSTQAFHRFSRRPFVRRTLYIGYGLRVVCSVLFPLGMVIDLFPGLLSVGITEAIFRQDYSFIPTLATTLIQGTFVNIVLGVLMLVVYAFQWAVCEPPQQNEDLCEKCGYDLRASYEFGRCPECGTPCRGRLRLSGASLQCGP